MAQRLDMTVKQGVSHNDDIDDAILNALEKNIPIIAFHSHPEGYPPSVDDFNVAYDYGYTLGVVAGHNGQVYVYSNDAKHIDNPDFFQDNIALAYKRGYDIDRAFREIYDELGFSYRIEKE